MITPHAADPCSKKSNRPRPPPAPSLLGVVIDRIPQTHRGPISLQTSGNESLTDKELNTLAFHDRLAAVGVGMPAVALRRSTRASAPSVRLRPLPDHVARAARAPRATLAPPFRTVCARSPSTGVAGQYPREGGGIEKPTSSVVVPTGRGMTSAVPAGRPQRYLGVARVHPYEGGRVAA